MPRPRSQRPPSVSGEEQSAAARAAPAAATAAGAGTRNNNDGGENDRGDVDAGRLALPRRFSESTAYGHHSRVFDVAFRSLVGDEGEGPWYLASAGEDEVVRVWRRRRKREERNGDDDNCDCIDGDRRSRSTSTSTSTTSTSTTAFDQVAALRGHGEPVLRVAWGPAGSRLLASAGGDRAARIWRMERGDDGMDVDDDGIDDDVDGGGSRGSRGGGGGNDNNNNDDDKGVRFREARVLSGHAEEVYACEFTPDSRSVVTASRDRVFLWDVETGKEIQGFSGSGSGNDGNDDGNDDDSGPPQPPPPASAGGEESGGATLPARWAAAHVFSATLSPPCSSSSSSGLVAAACSDGCLRLWSLRQQGRGGALSSSSPSSSSSSLALSPLAATRIHPASPAAACCWSRDGHRVAVTGSRSGGVAVVDVRKVGEGACWRGSVVVSSSSSSSSSFSSSPSPSTSSSSAMGACFFRSKNDSGKELLAVATGSGRVALFDVDGGGSSREDNIDVDGDAPSPPPSPSFSSSPSPPLCFLQSRLPAASATRNMLCVAPGPLPGTLAASGDAFSGGNGGGGGGGGLFQSGVGVGVGVGVGGNEARRLSKWSPISFFWEEEN